MDRNSDRIAELEELFADLGMEIGVLKQERARLWLALKDLLESPSPATRAAAVAAKASVRIDE